MKQAMNKVSFFSIVVFSVPQVLFAAIDPCKEYYLTVMRETRPISILVENQGGDPETIRPIARCHEKAGGPQYCLLTAKTRSGKTMALLNNSTGEYSFGNSFNPDRENEELSIHSDSLHGEREWDGGPVPFGPRDKYQACLDYSCSNKSIRFRVYFGDASWWIRIWKVDREINATCEPINSLVD